MAGKVAIVTGSSRGIGAAIARRLAADGAAVVINGSARNNEAEAVVADIARNGGRAVFVEADLVGAEGADDLVRSTLDAYGQPDILVTNAGVGLWVEPGVGPLVDQVTEADFDRVFAVNTRGVFFTLQAVARVMNDGGRIVNISSSTTRFPNPGFSVYSGSKSGPLSFVDVLARELGPRGITANSVILGPIAAGLLEDASPDVVAMLSAQSPLGRVGTVDDAADVVAFLAGDAARWISGERILVNGAATV
ncbi:SDR family oxidoreductase [Streptomyces sp. NPDC020801]|uniref:SDR family oxidoreductase n=1 Tax=unclassified Streptomyces TaxID=2593676 RepID=UPI00378C4244